MRRSLRLGGIILQTIRGRVASVGKGYWGSALSSF